MSDTIPQPVSNGCRKYVKSRIDFNNFNTFINVEYKKDKRTMNLTLRDIHVGDWGAGMERDNKTLHLVLKRKWWDMIASGEKREEYREVCHYWATRLLDEQYRWYSQNTDYPKDFDWWLFWKLVIKSISFREYSKVCFHLGYTNTTMTFNIVKMFMGIGTEYCKEEWGAEPNKHYFVIKLGERIE